MFLSAVVVSTALSAVATDVPRIDSSPPECAHAKTAARGWAAEQGAPAALASSGDTDVLHYALDIELDPDAEWLGGSNTMSVRSTVDNLSAFQFRLDDVFTITDVRVDGVPAAFVRLDGETLEVTLAPAYNTDEVFELFVAYEGYPDGGGFGSIVFRQRGGAREIWTLSEPWFAHTWWPGKDDSTDKTTADLWFTVPSDLIVASNGVLQGVDSLSGNRNRYRWKTEYQTADYLYCIGATNYNIFVETWQYGDVSMPLEFYIYPEDDNTSNRDAWRLNLDMLDVFSDHYGLYPFADEKYGMCQVGFGGGMEHQTMTSQGGFWESITAHELGHSWWGDMITCATWHDIWLNEGFATYSEAIWYGNRPGSSGMADYHARMEQRRPFQVGDSVYVYDTSSVNRIFSSDFSYRKAAWVVHMLRHVLGDQEFFDVIGAYRQAYEYDSATTEDFRAVAESVSGRDLGWFFSEWIYDIGAPAYQRAWRAHSVAGREYVEVYLRQVQDASYPIFTMPLDVQTDGAAGEKVYVIWNDAATEHLLFEVAGTVSSIALDPDDWTLHTSNTTTSFVEGPPKIVVTTPDPGATVTAGCDFTAEVTFHKDVVVNAGQFVLTGDVSGVIATTFSYDGPSYTVTLETAALAPDTYSLLIDDAIVDVAAGLALDGEVVSATDPAALPSGDGLPGGDALVRFTVAAPAGDLDDDGDVDFTDLANLLACWGVVVPGCEFADIVTGGGSNGAVDFDDLTELLAAWGTCP